MAKKELKPGEFALWPNDYKQKDTHPDWTGKFKLPDGTVIDIAAWDNQAQGSGKKYLKGSIRVKQEKDRPQRPQNPPPRSHDEGFDDDIPF